MSEFYVLAALLAKHWLADFPLQHWPWLYSHKGEYGHWGGICHAGIHAWLTLVILGLFGIEALPAIMAMMADYLAHYHIDYAKMRLSAARGWSRLITSRSTMFDPETRMTRGVGPHLAIFSNWYFQALGADQALHHATYVALVLIFV